MRTGWRGERDTAAIPRGCRRNDRTLKCCVALPPHCYGNGTRRGWRGQYHYQKGGSEWHGSRNTYFNARNIRRRRDQTRTNFSLNGPLGVGSASVCMATSTKRRLMRVILTRGISLNVLSGVTPTRYQQDAGVINKDNGAWFVGMHSASVWSWRPVTVAGQHSMPVILRT